MSIYLSNNNWSFLGDKIYNGKNTISAVYAGSKKVYPLNFQDQLISGLTIDGKDYIPPAILVMPGAKANNAGVYIETFTPATYEPLLLQKVMKSKYYAVFCGLYRVAENVNLTPKTFEKSSSSSLFKEGTWTFDRYTDNGTITENIPLVGDTYFDIVTPVINRYMLISGWLDSENSIQYLPDWLNLDDYETVTTIKGLDTTHIKDSVIYGMRPCGCLMPELFLQPITIPDGAEFITGGFSARNGAHDLVGSNVNLSDYKAIAQATGVSLSGTIPSGAPCIYLNGDTTLTTISGAGRVGSIFGQDSTGFISPKANNTGYAEITGIYSDGSLHSGTYSSYGGYDRIGQIYSTVDNIITELVTQDNFLWYSGTYTGT